MGINLTPDYWEETNLKPAFSENNVVVSLASDDNYVKFLFVVLASIRANAAPDKNYDIIILSDGISREHRAAIVGEIGQENISVRFVDAEHYLSDKELRTDWHIRRATYLRFAIVDIFDCYDKVLYLDCDIVVHRDVGELFGCCIDGKMLAAAKDLGMQGWCRKPGPEGEEKTRYVKEVVKVKDLSHYFNAGVLVMNLSEFRRRGYTTEKLIQLAVETQWNWMDQDLLNAICYGSVEFLDQRWNVMVHAPKPGEQIPEMRLPDGQYDDYLTLLDDPYLVHYAGHVIPVFTPTVECGHLFWRYARTVSVIGQLEEDMVQHIVMMHENNSPIRKLIDALIPYGSRRHLFLRAIVRAVFPKKK